MSTPRPPRNDGPDDSSYDGAYGGAYGDAVGGSYGGADWDPDGRADGRRGPGAHLPGKVLALVIVAVAIGAIGVFTGFAAFLGSAATATGPTPTDLDLGAVLFSAVFSFVLGVGLWCAAFLVWRRSRFALPLLFVLLALLLAQSLWGVMTGEVTFVSVVGTAASLLAIGATAMLALSEEVRDFVGRIGKGVD